MTRLVRFSLALGCAVALSGLALAQTPNLDLKVGLWEMTMNIDMGAAPPGMDTSKMTPEQQAQIAAMMRGRGAGGGMPATTIKNCLTKEKLAEHKYTSDRPGTTCTSKITKATSTTMDMTQTCTGTEPSTSEVHMEAASPTSTKMTMKMTSGRGAGTSVTITGKWLSADCGDIK